MKYTLFTGCSYSAGSGFDLGKQDPDLWVNQLYSGMFTDTELLNISSAGRSNAGVFQDTVKALLNYPVKTAIVQWTSCPRYNIELGFELYDTFQSFAPNGQCRDHNLNDINYSKSYLTTVQDRFVALSHDFYEILNLVEYTDSITKLAAVSQTQVYFVNGLCPWDNNFFTQLSNVLPNQYTKYTQKLLNVHNRDDDEVFKLYDRMHHRLSQAGGINPMQWLNLYSSMRSTRIDTNNDHVHPGSQSNSQYANTFKDILIERLS